MFHATWDDTSNIGVVNLTKAKLKEFTTGAGSDKGEHTTSMLKNTLFIGIVHTLRSQMRNTYGNGRPCVQIDTEVSYTSHDIRREYAAAQRSKSQAAMPQKYVPHLHKIGALSDLWYGLYSG